MCRRICNLCAFCDESSRDFRCLQRAHVAGDRRPPKHFRCTRRGAYSVLDYRLDARVRAQLVVSLLLHILSNSSCLLAGRQKRLLADLCMSRMTRRCIRDRRYRALPRLFVSNCCLCFYLLVQFGALQGSVPVAVAFHVYKRGRHEPKLPLWTLRLVKPAIMSARARAHGASAAASNAEINIADDIENMMRRDPSVSESDIEAVLASERHARDYGRWLCNGRKGPEPVGFQKSHRFFKSRTDSRTPLVRRVRVRDLRARWRALRPKCSH